MPRHTHPHPFPVARNQCGYCGQVFPTQAGVRQHIGHSPRCQAAALQNAINHDDSFLGYEGGPNEHDGPLVANLESGHDTANAKINKRYVRKYDEGHAADVLGSAKTMFESMKDLQEVSGRGAYTPFTDRHKWELADWLITNMNQQATNEFLKLPIVSHINPYSRWHLLAAQTREWTQPAYKSMHTLMKLIDQLPTGPEWQCELVDVHGDAVIPREPGDAKADEGHDIELEGEGKELEL